MDAQAFIAGKALFAPWLARLSGGQVEETKAELAQYTSAVDARRPAG
ncbi:hypothetical protein ACFFTM_14250 [Pseudoduganella plicata]|uniref:Uncharacterized protein n=1 Tax=Pseudoduganella plicata TaxID=321984 RepID=A0AA87Y814_9BURK|nr:hypothetical protein [Pseudoduganella plicata]GGY89619.1 hypothetical protein GCM10007388_23930 [Pseudoduganella plicata]